MPPGEVRFGDISRLIGSSLDITSESWTLDVIWAGWLRWESLVTTSSGRL
jgi:hypothetical protein